MILTISMQRKGANSNNLNIPNSYQTAKGTEVSRKEFKFAKKMKLKLP